MNRVYIYLSILLGIKILLLIFLGCLILKGQIWLRSRRRAQKVISNEIFYCVKSSLKQMNEQFYVGQIVFTNKKNCTLAAQSELPRHSSEGPD
jgi:hypothetical protein